MSFITPTMAETVWGIETDITYKYELKQLRMFGTDYTLFLKENATMRVIFTDLTDTGYTYDVYNVSGYMLSNETTFEVVPVNETSYTLPIGLPIAMPLQIGSISDYLSYYGNYINETSSLMILDEELLNLTEYANVTETLVYSTINDVYLKLNLYAFAETVNASVFTDLLGEGDTGFPITIPTNITDFHLNVTVSYNVTSGICKDLVLKIRSKSEQYGYVEDFNVDVKYGLYIPPPPTPTPTPTPTDTSYPWFIPVVVVFLAFGVYLSRKKKR
jgi:hypothetical protein